MLWLLHALYWLPFAIRALGRRGAEPNAAGKVATGSSGGVMLHGIGFGLLYLSLLVSGTAPAFGLGRVLGALTLLGAAALATWTLVVFRSWRIQAAIDPGHQLCTEGPFKWVRHPIYVSMDLLALGSWLWAPRFLLGAAFILIFAAGMMRARVEEKLLVESFGDAYRDYMKTTGAFLPHRKSVQSG